MQSKSDIKVTIVVPVHNSEDYLPQCLESALSQTLHDIEILCIDSGNTDRCFQIIAPIKERDNRIVYIRDSNSSYGYKINTGIRMARGDYIAILETDDQMPPDMMEKLYSAGELHHVDMVSSDYFRFFEHNGKKIGKRCEIFPGCLVYGQSMNYTVKPYMAVVPDEGSRKFDAELSEFFSAPKKDKGFYPAYTIGIWAFLYRKTFLLENHIRLNESPGASYQDSSFLFLTRLLAKSVYHLDEPLYWYRTDNAGSSVKDDRKIFVVAGEWNFLKQELEKRNIKDAGVWNLFYYEKYISFFWNYYRLPEKARERFLERYLEELRGDIAAGAVSREMRDEGFYQWTFLLLDDPDQFRKNADEVIQRETDMTLYETLERLEGREVVIFGAGILSREVIDVLRQNENRILGICDNNRKLHGTTLAGVEINPVAETAKRFPDACYLIVSRWRSDEMKAHLLAEGISERNIEIFK